VPGSDDEYLREAANADKEQDECFCQIRRLTMAGLNSQWEKLQKRNRTHPKKV
jgi:hypothetical protein